MDYGSLERLWIDGTTMTPTPQRAGCAADGIMVASQRYYSRLPPSSGFPALRDWQSWTCIGAAWFREPFALR